MQKQVLAFLLIFQLVAVSKLYSQNIAVNATGSLPDTSAVLDVSSTSKGLLLPRMTTTQVSAITLPATGLIIFNTTINAFEVNIGTASSPNWVTLGSSNSYTPNTRGVYTNAPLSGGGDLSADRTLSIDTTSTSGAATKHDIINLISKSSLSANAPLSYNNSTGVFSADTSTGATHLTTQGFVTRQGYITGNQSISFAPTGDVTGSTSGTTSLAPVLSIGVGKVTNTTIANGTIDLTAKVTGILPIANGGTNSGTALSNNRVMQSSGGKIVEAAAITGNKALISDANGIPTQSTVTNTELGYVSGVTSAIQTQLNTKQSTTLTNTHILVGNASNVAIDVAASGDVTLANTGAFTIVNGAVTNVKLANSTISGVSLGSNLNALTMGYGLTGTSYNGSTAVTTKVDTSTSVTNPATQGFVTRGNWATTGNTGTNSGSTFIGTTDLVSMRFRTNNTERMVIDSLGNVGIGTTTPSNALSLDGNALKRIAMERNTIANSAGNFLTIKSGGATSGATNQSAGALNLVTGNSTGTGTGDIVFFTTPAGTTGTADNTNTQKMIIKGNGMVGIGQATPVTNLHLYGASNAGTPFGNGPEIAFSRGGFANPGASIQMIDYNAFSAGLVFNVHKGINNGGTGSNLDNWPTDVINAMIIDNMGNVGIGTTAPADKLQVVTSTNSFGVSHTDGTNDISTWVGTTGGITGGFIGTYANVPLGFYTDNSTPEMVLSTAGNVGVGVVSPTAALHLKAGTATASSAPIKINDGTVLTTIEKGAIEKDANVFYATPDATNRGLLPTISYTVLSSDFTLTNGASAQDVFASAQDVVNVTASTTYEFEAQYILSTGTTTTRTISTLFGGTATLTGITYSAELSTGAANTFTATVSRTNVNAATAKVLDATNTNAEAVITLKGIVRVNAAGTFIPEIQFSAAPGGTNKCLTNSFFKLTPIGSGTVTSIGSWN
jgi:hypothetical protein